MKTPESFGIDFDFHGQKYTYDIGKKSRIGPSVEQEKMEIAAEIAFISAVLVTYQIMVYRKKREFDKFKNSNYESARNALAKKTENPSSSARIAKTAVEEYISTMPQAVSLYDDLGELEIKVLELESVKWSLINKKDMLQSIREM